MIAPDNHLVLAAVLFGIVALCLWLERFRWARTLTAALLVIVIPLFLSNAGVIPTRAPLYSLVSEYFVPVAVPLLLFKANLRRIFAETGRTLAAFALAAVGTMVGISAAVMLIPIGADRAQIGGTIAAGYIGGGMNFVAVARAVGLDDPTRFATVLGAEASVGLLYLAFLAMVPSLGWFRRWVDADRARGDGPSEAAPVATGPRPVVSTTHLAIGLGLSLAICAVGTAIARGLGVPGYSILFITALAVLVANVAPGPLANLGGDVEIGMVLMYVFFAVFGAGTDMATLIREAPVLLAFCALAIVIHFAVVFGIGRMLRLSAAELAIGSNACVLGPPTAAALAAGQGWHALVTPGILCGVLGYVVGNFLGVALTGLLARIG